MSRVVDSLQDEVAALAATTLVVVRRGGAQALLAFLVFAAPSAAVLAFAKMYHELFLRAPVLFAVLYNAPLVAFGIALEREPRLLAVLWRAVVRVPGVLVVCLFSGGALFSAVAVTGGIGVALSQVSAHTELGTIVVGGVVGVFVAVSAFVVWSRYVLFAVAITVLDRGGFLFTLDRVEELARRRTLALAVAAVVPVGLVVATFPGLVSDDFGGGALAPGTLARLRLGVFVGALVFAFFSCAALSASAYGLSTKKAVELSA